MNPKISYILNHKATIPSVTGVVGAAVGFVSGVFYNKYTAKKKTEKVEPYEQLILPFTVEKHDPIEYVKVVPPPSDIQPVATLSKEEASYYDKIMAEYTPEKEDRVIQEQQSPVNVFLARGDPGAEWDWPTELANRSTELPYIIHIEEFIGQESGYNQETVTYYAADDVVVDEQDQIMQDYRKVLGELQFGHGSQDKNIVYVRNDKWGCEWEILLDSGSYLESVVSENAMDEIKHHKVPKFKKEE